MPAYGQETERYGPHELRDADSIRHLRICTNLNSSRAIVNEAVSNGDSLVGG